MNMRSHILHNTEQESSLNMLLAMRPVYAKNFEVAAFDPVIKYLDESRETTTADDMQALSVVIGETYSSVPRPGGTQKVPSFLRITDQMVTDLELPNFPTDSFIIEISPASTISPEAVNFYKKLSKSGYRLALAVNQPDIAPIEPYLDFIHMIKLNVDAVDIAKARAFMQKSQPYGLDLVACNLGSKPQFLEYVNLGFTYFSGDVLGKPQNSENKKLGHNKIVLFQLLAELQNPDATIADIEQIVLKDPNLTFKILKIVNSAALGLSREINSVSHAISILGMNQMRRWVSVFLLEDSGNNPMEVMRSSLVRARMCEIIAELSGKDMPISYFMVGLLSRLDLIADIEMAEIVKQIPLTQDIKGALVNRAGDMGQVLKEVEIYELGNFDALQRLLEMNFYEVCYRHSNAWANQVQKALTN